MDTADNSPRTALATTQPQTIAGLSLKTASGIAMAKVLEEQTEQRQILGLYVKRNMVAGTDYGVIPGTKENTLLKPGAEKLIDLFRCVAEFEPTQRIEDWDRGLFHYEFKCIIRSRDTGAIVAQGIGSANSREGKWRWRNANLKCPDCGKEAICKSKFPPRDNPREPAGFYCYDKKGGCGANFAFNDTRVIDQPRGKIENDDVATLVNTILKIGTKRAMVAGAIQLARCSDIFTQDVEDLPESITGHEPPDDGAATRGAGESHRGPDHDDSRRSTAAPNGSDATKDLLQDPEIVRLCDDIGLNGGQRTIRLKKADNDKAKLLALLREELAKKSPSGDGSNNGNRRQTTSGTSSRPADDGKDENYYLDQIAGCLTRAHVQELIPGIEGALPRLEEARPGAHERLNKALNERLREIGDEPANAGPKQTSKPPTRRGSATPSDTDDIRF